MRRIVLYILAFFLLFINLSADAAIKTTQKEIEAVSVDGFNMKATLTYPKVKGKREFQTVVLLHSIGYNSQWWGDLPTDLLEKGYAVLAIDLRGHGKSIYNAKLGKISWKNLKNSGYAKYPDDVLSIINKVKEENTKTKFFNSWALVGADVGASAGVIASDKLNNDPKTLIMISPVVETKGLYIPVNIAHLDTTDFLAILGTDDSDSKEAAEYLSKFAQNEFSVFTSTSKTTGMLMLKNDESLSKMIAEWISEYLY